MYFNGMLIAMVPDKYLILINILTHLISRYQLPLTGHGLYDWYMHILRTCFLYLISNDLVVLFLFLFLLIYNFGGEGNHTLTFCTMFLTPFGVNVIHFWPRKTRIKDIFFMPRSKAQGFQHSRGHWISEGVHGVWEIFWRTFLSKLLCESLGPMDIGQCKYS